MNILERNIQSFMLTVDALGGFDDAARDMIEKSFFMGLLTMHNRLEQTKIFSEIEDSDFELHEISEEYKELFERYMA